MLALFDFDCGDERHWNVIRQYLENRLYDYMIEFTVN